MLSIGESLGLLIGKTELPSVEDFICILQQCNETKNLENVKRVHMHICLNGLESHVELANNLIPVFFECGSMSDAHQVFTRVSHQDEYSWSCLIRGYIKHGKFKNALTLYENMQDEFIYPSKYTYVALLKACAGLECVGRGHFIHTEIVKAGLEEDPFIGSTLEDMYVKSGSLSEAHEVFDSLPVQDVVSWTALIAGYVEHKLDKEALVCFEQMRSEGVSPNAVTYISSLKACSSIGIMERGQEIHSEVVKEGLEKDGFLGNTLVNMYAKCGYVGEAQKVFDNLLARDVFSWNALIAGYADHGCHGEALNCLEQMKLEGVVPDAVTLFCSLKVCCSLESVDKGREIHTEVAKEGLEKEVFFGNTLVDMYANYGSLLEAHEIFDELPNHDVVSWTVLISGYAEHGFSEKALKVLKQMELEGVCQSDATYICSLKACGSSGALDRGQELHAEIVAKGVEGQPFICSTLVDMYAKCGSLEDARDVFYKLPVPDVVSWTALIQGYAEHGLGDEAMTFLNQTQLVGMLLDAVMLATILRVCGSIGTVYWGRGIHGEIVKKGLESDAYLGNSLVDMYAKFGILLEAQDVFNKLQGHDIVSWNTLISGYVEQGLEKEALNCFKKMLLKEVSPDAITFVCCLKACRSLKAINIGRDIHDKIIKRGFEDDYCVSIILINMYASCGLLAEAGELFDKLPVQDVTAWSALIAGYDELGLEEDVFTFLEQMQIEAMSVDTVTLACCLKFCGRVGALYRGQEIHAEISKKGCEDNLCVGNSLVELYAKCGSFEEAQYVLDGILAPDVMSWTALIDGYAGGGNDEEAMNCLQRMQMEGISPDVFSWNAVIANYAEQGKSEAVFNLVAKMQEQGLLPSSITFFSTLKACGNLAALENGKLVHTQIHGTGDDASEMSLATALIDMYGKCGSMIGAQQLFDAMCIKDLVAWNALLAGYARQGESERVCHLFEKLREEGLQPNGITFFLVLTACSHAGLLHQGCEYFDLMTKNYSIMPNIEHCNCMIDLFGRAGQLEEVAILLEKMSFQPNLVTWGIVLGSCRKWGNVELGGHAFGCTMRLNDKHNAAYILMSNIYADSGLWVEPTKKIDAMAWKRRMKMCHTSWSSITRQHNRAEACILYNTSTPKMNATWRHL